MTPLWLYWFLNTAIVRRKSLFLKQGCQAWLAGWIWSMEMGHPNHEASQRVGWTAFTPAATRATVSAGSAPGGITMLSFAPLLNIPFGIPPGTQFCSSDTNSWMLALLPSFWVEILRDTNLWLQGKWQQH